MIPHSCWRLLVCMFAVALIHFLPNASAQLPFLIIDDARVFESNSGSSAILRFPVRFVGNQPTTVTGLVTVIPLPGAGFNAATGGAACGGAVDFEQFINVPFSIPPNTPNGTLSVNVAICGDNTIELDEQVVAIFSNVAGADCSLEGGCNAIGSIINDDGPPGIQINNVFVSTLAGASRTVNFTVSLHHPSSLPVSVNFRTRDGTARARTTTTPGSYFARSGTLEIPPNTLSATIPVTITGFGEGTFFMDLFSPVNGTIVDGTGQATIRIITLTVGSFDVAPGNDRVTPGETTNFQVTWIAPEGEVWRDIDTIDFRLRKGNNTALLVQWNEAANTFKVCDDSSGSLECSDEALPGTATILESSLAELLLAESSVVGSGPTGATVTLNLAVRFKDQAAGNYTVELGGADDFGNEDDFFTVTKIHVDNANKP